jgi:hypothetical protein
MAGSIQFFGKDQVIQAFQNRNVDVFSIFQHKQMLTKGKGDAEFSAFIELLCSGTSNAIYTVYVYEDLEDHKAVKSNTPNDGGFNFRLNDESQLITGQQYNRMGVQNQLLQEIQLLRKEVKDLQEEEEAEEAEKPHNLGMIGDIMSHPAVSPIVPFIVQHIVSQIMGVPINLQTMQNAQSLGNIPAEEETKLQQGIAILKKHDPNLGTHILKLATIAEKDKPGFNYLIGVLNGIQV